MAEELNKLSAQAIHTTLAFRKPDGVRRRDIVTAFQHAFEMIGGVSRFALWADQNPTEFYRLYARLLPPQITPDEEATGERIIRLRVPRNALDGPPRAGVVIEMEVEPEGLTDQPEGTASRRAPCGS
jgi:hypothetical protein